MRGKTKIMATAIAWLTLLTLTMMPSFAQTTTTLAPDPLDTADLTLGPGMPFSIDIKVTDAEDLWGFQFVLIFDASILSATGYSFYSPFVIPQPSAIGPGYAALAANMPFGTPIGGGVYGDAAIAKIDFIVNAYGSSVLDLGDVLMVNPGGAALPHELLDGSFANVEVAYWVNLVRAIPEHQSWIESKDSTNTLHAKVKNKGAVTVLVKVVFTIRDTEIFTAYAETEPVTMKRNQMYDFTYTITKGWLLVEGQSVLMLFGKYYVTATTYYYEAGAWHSVKPEIFHFTLKH